MNHLLARVRACEICASDLPEGPRPVLQAHPSALILIAGQAPGRRVHASGIPFQDPSGVRLREWMGVTEEEFYDETLVAILPMGFCYPGSGSSGDLPPRPECAPAWREPILSQLRCVELTLVLGKYALEYHLGTSGRVTEAVASWEDHWPSRVPLPHPSPRNQSWFKRHPWFEREVLPRLRKRVRALIDRRD